MSTPSGQKNRKSRKTSHDTKPKKGEANASLNPFFYANDSH